MKKLVNYIEEALITNTVKIDLSNQDITAIPATIGQLRVLEEIRLSGNKQLKDFPQEFSQLTRLRKIDISSCEMSTLPKVIFQLPNLEVINLSNNNLSTLPAEIHLLTKLQIVYLSDNKLSRLPTEVGLLVNLKELHLNNNQLAELPSEIGKLINLNTLSLYNNRLIAVPPEIGNIKKLTTLDLANNPIKELPLEIKKLSNLNSINLDNTQIHIAHEIGFRDAQAIIAYIIDQKKSRHPLNEVKLLIVGQGSVGKTSIVQQILHGTFDQKQNKTEGISINQWQVEVRKKQKSSSQISNPESSIKLNIWDFGGQEIMHATHQFFLTKRSLYLLVLDARLTQEENRVEYWLKIIQSFGGESPVLIVGNKTDQHPLDIDRTGLQKKYPNIVGVLGTSAATGAGIRVLKAEIAKQVDTLPHVRDLLPETWFIVKSKLEELARNKNFFTQDEYLGLCDENNVTDETSQHTLIGFLHDLGVVLHFQDDPRLEALGILNPQWVTNGVYKILNSHELFQNQGKLTLPLLNQILDAPEYPANKRLFIVDMMKKFELCYDIEPDKSFLIPDLLPKDEPYTGEWDDALAFQIHYNVLPSSIISRFIVRMNAFIHKTIWRSGVVLNSSGNTALVKADVEDRKIYIWINGDEPTRRDFLSAIRTEFDAIHSTIAKIEVTEKVPLPSQPQVPPVDYSFLLRLERNGRTTFPIEAGDKIIDIDLKGLLDGITTPEQRRNEFGFQLQHTAALTPASKFAVALKTILAFPKYLGRFVFDLFGRHDSAESSSIIFGWTLILVMVLVLQGLINLDAIIKSLINIWQFFNPAK